MDLSLFLNKRQAKDLARRILIVGSNRGTAAPACFDRNLATIQPIIMLDSRATPAASLAPLIMPFAWRLDSAVELGSAERKGSVNCSSTVRRV